jgi:hypothetical protein
MKWFFLLFIIFIMISSYFLLYSYSGHVQKKTGLLDPYVSPLSSEEVAGDATISATLESDVPISCVLSFGTYMVSQSQCDELTLTDTTPNPDAEMISCILPEGTFSLTSHECDILKTSTGSRDVMKTLD